MALPPAASRQSNRLSSADLAAIREAIAATVCTYPPGYQPSIGADFNDLQHRAYRAIGCVGWDLRDAEVDQIADLVVAAIYPGGAAR